VSRGASQPTAVMPIAVPIAVIVARRVAIRRAPCVIGGIA
jgi:hypothetical protein